MKTSYKQTLRIHNQSKHGDIEFDCDQCEYKAKTKGNLRVHTLSKHGTQRNTKVLAESAKKSILGFRKNQNTWISNLIVINVIIIDCDQCEHKAKHKGSLRLHKQ